MTLEMYVLTWDRHNNVAGLVLTYLWIFIIQRTTVAWGMDFVSIHVLFMMYDVYWYCQMKKNDWLWKFWKRNDLYENFEKKGGSREKGEEEAKCMPHAHVSDMRQIDGFLRVLRFPPPINFLPCLHMALSYQAVPKTLT
jgi:hypothetical protein